MTRRPRRARLATLLLLAAIGRAAIGCGSPPGDEPEAPHLVLAVVDALRRDHLGLYGYDKPTSPFLDRLAGQGVAFDDAHAQGSETFVSTSTLLTSRLFPLLGPSPELPADSGLDEAARRRHSWVPVLREQNLTLAETLATAGYDTFAAFTNPHHHPASGFWQGFGEARLLPPPEGRKTAYARAPKVVNAFLDWLDRRDGAEVPGSGLPGSGPVFAYLHFMDPHNPYRPPRDLRRQFVTTGGRDLYRNGKPLETPTTDDLAFMQALYDGEIRWFDEALAALVEALEQRGLWRRTVLLVASDHGDEFMEHGGLGHGESLEPELLRVPLVVAGPPLAGLGVAPRRVPALVRNLDLAPTLAELAGTVPVAAFEGSSLLPLMRGATAETAIAEPRPPALARRGPLRSATTGRWHFILDLASGEGRLYDRRSDPGGTVDAAVAHPEAAASLTHRIEAMENDRRQSEAEAARLGDPQEPAVEIDPAVREQLEALGYLD